MRVTAGGGDSAETGEGSLISKRGGVHSGEFYSGEPKQSLPRREHGSEAHRSHLPESSAESLSLMWPALARGVSERDPAPESSGCTARGLPVFSPSSVTTSDPMLWL